MTALGDLCALACAEAFLGDGNAMISPMAPIPKLGAKLCKALWEPDLVLTDGVATIVDLDGFAVGEPAIDVGNYLAKLFKESLEPGWSHLRDLGAPFLEDYLAAAHSEGIEARALVNEAAALGRLAFRELHTSPRANDDASPPASMLNEGIACLDRLHGR